MSTPRFDSGRNFPLLRTQHTTDCRVSQIYIDARESNEMIYGVPFLELNSKARVPLRGYGRDKTKLSFVYTVGLGEETPPGQRLTMAPNTTINLNGATIRDDATDLDAVLMPVPIFGEQMSVLGPSSAPPPRIPPGAPVNAKRPALHSAVHAVVRTFQWQIFRGRSKMSFRALKSCSTTEILLRPLQWRAVVRSSQ
jgi:hypothetical protein